MGRESGLRQKVGKLLREHGFFVQTIESGTTSEGIPDLYYANEGNTGWMELKKVQEWPKRQTTSVFRSLNHPLSIYQANWISLARRAGVVVHVLVGYGPQYFLVPGEFAEDADRFNDMTEGDLKKYAVTREELVARLKW